MAVGSASPSILSRFYPPPPELLVPSSRFGIKPLVETDQISIVDGLLFHFLYFYWICFAVGGPQAVSVLVVFTEVAWPWAIAFAPGRCLFGR